MDAELFQDGEGASVRTAGAKNRRACRNLCGRGGFQFHAKDAFADHVGAVFALYGEEFLADTVNAPRLDLFFDQRFQFLKNIEFINF